MAGVLQGGAPPENSPPRRPRRAAANVAAITSVAVAVAGIGAIWVQAFQATNHCSENIGSVTKQYADGLATPCELIGWIFTFAGLLVVVLGAVAFTLALRDRLWMAAVTFALCGAVPFAVAAAYGSANLN